METTSRFLTSFDRALKKVADKYRQLIQEDHAALCAEQEQAIAELVQEMPKAHGRDRCRSADCSRWQHPMTRIHDGMAFSHIAPPIDDGSAKSEHC